MNTFHVLSIEDIKLNKIQTALISGNIQSTKEADLHTTPFSICDKWYDTVCAKYHRMWEVFLGVECVCVCVWCLCSDYDFLSLTITGTVNTTNVH